MGTPQFPDVPMLPGVPPVLRRAASEFQVQRALRENSPTPQQSGPQWGIFEEGGDLAVTPDSIVAFESRREYRISDYPIEAGGFESYNKVQIPYELRVSMTKAGSDAERGKFLQDIDNIIESIDFYSVVTPERIYTPVSPVSRDFRRTSENGVKLLVVEITCRQIRVEASLTFSDSKAPAGSDDVNDGPVQTTAAPADEGAPQ